MGACWHVGPCGIGCEGYVANPQAGQAREVMPPLRWVPDQVSEWEKIAKQLEAQLQISMEQTRIAQETCREAQKTAEEAIKMLNDHLKVCSTR